MVGMPKALLDQPIGKVVARQYRVCRAVREDSLAHILASLEFVINRCSGGAMDEAEIRPDGPSGTQEERNDDYFTRLCGDQFKEVE